MEKEQIIRDFLLNRRSHPAKTLKNPAPNENEIKVLLTAAMRSPDHGKLEPWRFIVLQKKALKRLANKARVRAIDLNLPEEAQSKIDFFFASIPLSIAVISSPKSSQKIPKIEQTLSAGAVCLALVNACLASGWGASWLTGWTSRDRLFLENELNLESHEFLAGYIHIGTKSFQPPERPRPNYETITTFLNE